RSAREARPGGGGACGVRARRVADAQHPRAHAAAGPGSRLRVVKTFPARFRDGIRLFNGGRYFEAHEAFEESLDELGDDARSELAVGLVQVAVGYHKWTSGHPGAARMLGLGAEKLAAFPPDAWGIDVEALRRRLATDIVAAGDGAVCDEPPRIVAA